MVESVTVQFIKHTLGMCGNSGSSGGVVQESELTESFTRLVGLQELGLGSTRELFGAVEVTLLNNEEDFTLIALLNNILTGLESLLVHSFDNNLEFIGLESLEHESLEEALFDLIFNFVGLRNDLLDVFFLLVVLSESFSGNRDSGLLFLACRDCHGREFANIFFTLRVR